MPEITQHTEIEKETRFDNAIVGEGTLIEPDVTVGFRYHRDCGPAWIGRHAILRKGTLIYGDTACGDYFQAGHYVVVRAKVQIGQYCTLLNRVTIEGIVRMGDGVRVMSHTYIPSRTWFGNHVFVGPGVTFLNDRIPGRYEEPPCPCGATIEDDVMIGGGSTVLPGITIGRLSFIAAGTVVTKDVPERSLVMGVPGRSQPLPSHLDRPNNRKLTIQPMDLWHPNIEDLSKIDWPEAWGPRSYHRSPQS